MQYIDDEVWLRVVNAIDNLLGEARFDGEFAIVPRPALAELDAAGNRLIVESQTADRAAEPSPN